MLFVDGGNDRVGIGTTSPSRALTVSGSTAPVIAIVDTGTSGTPSLFFGDSSADNVGKIQYSNSDNSLATVVNGSERMRIDSSGNFLVGTTSNNKNITGASLRQAGDGYFTRNDTPLYLNRLSSDGEILRFSKDGTVVGSIGSKSSNVFMSSISSNNTGFKINPDAITPSTSTGTDRDNAIDLGTSSARYKDIYLGGGAFIGGTGTSNKLDDYEEGTWTPTLSTAVSSITVSGYTSQIGSYVKVGRLVTLTCMIQATVTAFSNDPTITGLPFAPANNRFTGVSTGLSNLILSDDADNVSNGQRLAPSVRTGDIRFYFGSYNTSDADAYVCFTAQYETNA